MTFLDIDLVISDIDLEVPLTSCLLDLALLSVESRDCWVQREAPVRLFKVVLGRFLDKCVIINCRKKHIVLKCSQ